MKLVRSIRKDPSLSKNRVVDIESYPRFKEVLAPHPEVLGVLEGMGFTLPPGGRQATSGTLELTLVDIDKVIGLLEMLQNEANEAAEEWSNM